MMHGGAGASSPSRLESSRWIRPEIPSFFLVIVWTPRTPNLSPLIHERQSTEHPEAFRPANNQ
jgi:hypothetical protein